MGEISALELKSGSPHQSPKCTPTNKGKSAPENNKNPGLCCLSQSPSPVPVPLFSERLKAPNPWRCENSTPDLPNSPMRRAHAPPRQAGRCPALAVPGVQGDTNGTNGSGQKPPPGARLFPGRGGRARCSRARRHRRSAGDVVHGVGGATGCARGTGPGPLRPSAPRTFSCSRWPVGSLPLGVGDHGGTRPEGLSHHEHVARFRAGPGRRPAGRLAGSATGACGASAGLCGAVALGGHGLDERLGGAVGPRLEA